jgi:hypothetical protein
MADMQRLVLILTTGLVVLALYTFQRGTQPDPRLINLAVRATVHAMPSPSPLVIEVTREVEVTRVVEVVRVVEVTATTLLTSSARLLVPPIPPTESPLDWGVPGQVAQTSTSTFAQTAAQTVPPTLTPTPSSTPVADSAAEAEEAAALAVQAEIMTDQVAEPVAEVPVQSVGSQGCPATSAQQYTSIPVMGASASHPDSQHGDLNLALRGYVPAEATLALVDISGPTDGDAPQLAGVLGRLPAFGRAYRARDWNWSCGEHGCRGEELGNVEVSLVALQSGPGEAVHVPTRGAEIYGGGFVALVLYADASRLTLVYTREDSVANGYAVHLEDFCVDPNLLGLYQSNNAAGRGQLPGIRNGEVVGTARYDAVVVGVRDRGSFTDPRSRKDWWRGY